MPAFSNRRNQFSPCFRAEPPFSSRLVPRGAASIQTILLGAWSFLVKSKEAWAVPAGPSDRVRNLRQATVGSFIPGIAIFQHNDAMKFATRLSGKDRARFENTERSFFSHYLIVCHRRLPDAAIEFLRDLTIKIAICVGLQAV